MGFKGNQLKNKSGKPQKAKQKSPQKGGKMSERRDELSPTPPLPLMKRAILCGPNRIISGAILGWCPNYTSPDKCGPLVFTSVDIIMQGRQEPIRLTLEDGAEAFMSKVDDQPHFAYLKELADRQAGVLAQTEATPAS